MHVVLWNLLKTDAWTVTELCVSDQSVEKDFTCKTNFPDFQNFCWHTFTPHKLLIVGYTLVAIITLPAVLFEGKITYISIYVVNTFSEGCEWNDCLLIIFQF